MMKFFDFHDSILLAIDFKEAIVTLRMKAILVVWEGGVESSSGTSFSQIIEVRIENASVEGCFAKFPVWLYDGAFSAARILPVQEDVPPEAIPASLSSAEEVGLRLEGEEEVSGDYGIMNIRGSRASIELHGDPEFIQKLRHKQPQ